MPPHNLHSLLVRTARADDADALQRLAQLDSKRSLDGDVYVAESEGVLLAAIEADSGDAVADPFRPTAGAVELLRLHAGRRRTRRRSLRRLHTA